MTMLWPQSSRLKAMLPSRYTHEHRWFLIDADGMLLCYSLLLHRFEATRWLTGSIRPIVAGPVRATW